VILLIVSVPNIVTAFTFKYYSRAGFLMFEYVRICLNLFTTLLSVYTLEFNFSQQISSYSINLVELAIASTEWTMIWVFGKPLNFTVRTNRLFTDFALQRILKNVITHSTN